MNNQLNTLRSLETPIPTPPIHRQKWTKWLRNLIQESLWSKKPNNRHAKKGNEGMKINCNFCGQFPIARMYMQKMVLKILMTNGSWLQTIRKRVLMQV